ncbi:type II toxin-antitoxin system HicB family antitoxin [Paraburkholderia sp.]|uniref:type II toxin-antitoxin system HicB family antitoxin n=1 Tax=Paraburkholderia sp. TaxID=1926495 RepID=UPI003D701117
MKNLTFPIAIEPSDAKHAFGVVVPDIPGCVSAGDTLDEAYANVKEAIENHLGTLVDEGMPLPVRRPLDEHFGNPHYRGWIWAVVTVGHIAALRKAVRINISLPEVLVNDIDRYAQAHGMSRSAFLALAAEHEME